MTLNRNLNSYPHLMQDVAQENCYGSTTADDENLLPPKGKIKKNDPFY